MTHSVYNHATRRYDYYEATGLGGTHAGAPPAVSSGKIGAVPEAASWRLPMGAKKVGEGDLPKGRIASRGGLPALGAVDVSDPKTLLAAVGLGYLAYVAWRKLR